MLDRDAFQQHLRTEGAYATPDLPARRIRTGWTANLSYHRRALSCFISGCVKAQLGRFTPETWASHGLWILSIVESLGGKVHFDGFGPAAKSTMPVVWTANHMSSMETLIVPPALMAYSQLSCVVKESLMTYPLFGPIMRRIDPIAVSRRNPREDLKQVLTRGKAKLEAGRSVLLFPQATRARAFDADQFNSLGAKLASRSGVPLIPLAIKTDFLGVGRMVRDFGPVDPSREIRVAMGPVIPSDTPSRDMHAQTVEFISTRLASWGLTPDNTDTASD